MSLAVVGHRPSVVASVTSLEGAVNLALGVALGNGVALVVELLAPGEGDFELGAVVLEVEAKGDDGDALLRDFRVEFLNLPPVQEELAGAGGFRLLLVRAGLLVGGDVHVSHPRLAVADGDEAVAEVDFALAHALDFGAREDEARFKGFVYEEVVPRFAVDG